MNFFVRILIAVGWQVKKKTIGDDVQEEGVAQKSEKIRRFKSNFWISLNDSFHHPILFIWGNALKCSSPILKHHPAENFLRLNIIYSRKYGRHSFLSASQYVPNKNWQDWNNSSKIVNLRGKSHYPWRFVSWLPGGVLVPLVYCPFRSWHLTTNAESLELLFSSLPLLIFISWPPIAESLEVLFSFLHIIFIFFTSSISFSYPLYPLNDFHNLHLLYIIFISSISFSYPLYHFHILTTNAELL